MQHHFATTQQINLPEVKVSNPPLYLLISADVPFRYITNPANAAATAKKPKEERMPAAVKTPTAARKPATKRCQPRTFYSMVPAKAAHASFGRMPFCRNVAGRDIIKTEKDVIATGRDVIGYSERGHCQEQDYGATGFPAKARILNNRSTVLQITAGNPAKKQEIQPQQGWSPAAERTPTIAEMTAVARTLAKADTPSVNSKKVILFPVPSRDVTNKLSMAGNY